VILGIDPGLASTGYALVEGAAGRVRAVAHGVVRTAPSTPHALRLAALHDAVAGLLADHPVDGAAVESWFVHPVSRAAMGMAEARGAVLVAVARAGVEVQEYSPNTIKQSVTGSGGADKRQVRLMVARITGVDCGSDHAADAMAAAICHLSAAPLRGAIRRAR
jgi:crossover junction endodeoxyribonuclease RuvC